MQYNVVEHPLYGKIRVKVNPRARRIILRAREGFIEVTLPPGVTRKAFDAAVDKYGAKLWALSRATTLEVIDGTYKYESERFCFCLSEGEKRDFFIRYDGFRATFIYPQNTDFHSEEMQQWLRRVRVTALRRVASENLPRRLDYLSRRFNFCYNGVSLRDSHSRWGSCSSRGNISLSIYLQLLPEHLADYVMLHELCHTVEMNHSLRFWELMDNVTDGKSKQLRHELKSYRTSF